MTATRAEQNPRTSDSVHSPRSGWAPRAAAKGSPAPLEMGVTMRQLIAAGPEPRATATVPLGCPLPMGELASYVAESGATLACIDCSFFRTVELAAGGAPPHHDGPRVRYGFCTAPERAPMALVSAEPIEARPGAHASREVSDERVLACLGAGVTSVAEIARMSGLSPRAVWKAARRLKDGGQVDADLALAR